MDYEKIHELSLELGRKLIQENPELRGWVESKLPELRKSADERIRKILIEVVNITPASIAVRNKRELLDWLEKQKEQKPTEWEDYKDKVNIPYCSSEPEWSEEDERRIDAICELLENTSAIHPNYSHRRLIIWLKSLRPSWKPSEEQGDALVFAIKAFRERTPIRDNLLSLYNDLKKL